MKPSFALDFRDGAIALLHRTSRGWQQVGASSIEAPDLTEALGYLRSTALGLSPRGLATKLVIPNDQVLYTTIHAPGPEAAKRRKQIRAALEGMTPYKVDDLVFDWWGSGPEVQVAVVAKETLAEAEGFAAEHRFNPVSFVAAPDNGAYLGEPFFGPSALSATLLAEGEKVERDQEPIAVVARDYPRAEPATPQPAPPVEPEPNPASPVESEPQPSSQVELEPRPEALVIPDEADPPAAILAEPAAAPDIPPQPPEAPMKPAQEAPAPVAMDPLPDFSAARVPPEGTPPFDPKAMAVELVDEAPMALDVAEDDKTPMATEAPPPAVPDAKADLPKADDLPPAPASSILAAFSSRRAAEAVPPASHTEAAPADFAKAAAEARARKSPVVGPAPSQRPSVPRPTLAKPAAPLQGTSRGDALPFPGRAPAGKLPIGKTKPSQPAQGPTSAKLDRNVVPLPKAASAAAAKESAAQRPATGLDGKPLPAPGKPRYLFLILTGLLLLALAAVAAWSKFSLSSNGDAPGLQPAEIGLADTGTPTATDPNLPTAEEEALADGQDLAEPVQDSAAAATETAVAEPPVTETAAEPVSPAPDTGLTTSAVAATGSGSDPQDEIFLASNDVPPRTSDPVVLPSPAAGSDPPPQASAPPPPFGTVYSFDADGRIRPTPEGIITPEGVLLVEGSPKQIPPARPAALTEAAAPAAEPVADPAAAIAPGDAAAPAISTFEADPALAGKKPRSRPEGLVPPASEEQQGQAATPAPGSRFADIRPQQRPAALTEQPAATGADAAASAASLAATGLQEGGALAMAVSRKPMARPSGMDQAVDAAVAAALQTGDPQQPNDQAASLAPEEQTEPEVEAASPDIPTSASVAKQATTKDALNLSRLALIGIFGTSSGRYAMVRQPGGAIKKIVVGDSIDGGRVAAITATEVQYQKGGRMLSLTLPKG